MELISFWHQRQDSGVESRVWYVDRGNNKWTLITDWPEELDFQDQCCPKKLFYEAFAVQLEDSWPRPFSYQQQCSVNWVETNFISLKFRYLGNAMKIKSTKIMISTTHINLTNIKVTDSKMGFDSPVSFLTKISHHIYCELMVRNVHSLTIFTPYHRWWPPTHMLLNNADRQAVKTNWDNYTPSQQKVVKYSAKANGKRRAQ